MPLDDWISIDELVEMRREEDYSVVLEEVKRYYSDPLEQKEVMDEVESKFLSRSKLDVKNKFYSSPLSLSLVYVLYAVILVISYFMLHYLPSKSLEMGLEVDRVRLLLEFLLVASPLLGAVYFIKRKRRLARMGERRMGGKFKARREEIS